MANSIGSRIQQFLVSVLIGLLVIGFAIWGVNDVFSPKARNAVASLGGDEITTQEFESAFRRELQRLASTEGRQMPDQEAFNRGIHNEVLRNLVTTKVIEIDANDLGIGVNSRTARDYVSEIEVFQDEITGKFSEDRLNSVLARQNPPISRQKFEQDLIQDIRLQQTIPAINGGVVAPLEFAQQRYKFLTEQRKARVLTLTDKAVPAPAEPTDADLQDYIDANPIRFTAPEFRRITLLRIENSDIIPNLEVTDEEIQAEYDYRLELGELGSPAKRSLVQITAQDEDTAKSVAERLANGEDPDEIVALMSLIEPVTYTDVLESAILDPETATAAFDMEDGDTRAVLGSFGNWYALKVTGVTPAENPDFESMKDELTEAILDQKAQDKIYDLTEIIEDTQIESGSLEDAAEAAGVSISAIDFVDRSGTTQDGLKMAGIGPLKGIADDEEILTNIFTNELGYETDIFETSTGGWAALRVDDIVDSRVKDLDEVRDIATAFWKTEQIDEALNDKLIELGQAVQGGQTLEEALAQVPDGGSINEVVLVRSSPPQTLGGRVTVDLLDASVGDIVRGDGPTNLTRQIAILTDIVENADGLAGQFADVMQEQATAQIRMDLNQAYQNAVISDNPLRQYPEKVRQVLGLEDEG